MASTQIGHVPSLPNKRLILAAQFAFFPTGILMTLLGPMLPLLIARWALTDAHAGNLFLVQFLASVAGVQFSGVLLVKFGYRPAFLLGLLLMALGAASLLAGSAILGMIAVGVYGFGVGLIVPTDSLLIAEVSPNSRTRAVNLLNFFWGAGAVFCSLMIAWAAAHKAVTVFLMSVAVFMAVLAFAMWRLPFPAAERGAERGPVWRELARNPVIWLFATVFFLYPGAETAVGGWIGSYVGRLGPLEAKWTALMPAFFWAALTVGRGLGTLFLSHFSEQQVLRTGFASAAGGIILLLVASALPQVIVGALITGLSFATLYPITIARLSTHFGVAARGIGAVMFSLACIGPAVIPWMVGLVSQSRGSLRAGLLLPLGATVLLLVIHLRDW